MSVAFQLCGGLANRLFQIASAMGIAAKTGRKPIYEQQLNQTNVHQTKGSEQDYEYMLRGIEKKAPKPGYKIVGEVANKFAVCAPDFFQSLEGGGKEDLIILGYRQNEKDFEHVADRVRKQFSVPASKREELQAVVGKNSAFIHIRRGDYVNNPVHWVDLYKNYYTTAMKKFQEAGFLEKGKIDKWYVFSDDPQWCKTNLNSLFRDISLPSFSIIENDKFNEVETLWLISLCDRGGICANSTFSWWGSWLGEKEMKKEEKERLVIFPSKWMLDASFDCSDIYWKGSVVVPI